MGKPNKVISVKRPPFALNRIEVMTRENQLLINDLTDLVGTHLDDIADGESLARALHYSR